MSQSKLPSHQVDQMTMSDTSPLPIPAVGAAPPADPLLALLTDCEAADASIFTSVPALASLTADLVARNNEWVRQALAQVAYFRSALLARKTRLLGSAKRLSRKQCKGIAADFEAADVSTEQLRVWAAVTRAGVLHPVLDCAFAASPLLALPPRVQSPVVEFSSSVVLPLCGKLGSMVTCDRLRAMSAAGPGLMWFEPNFHNEFSVLLAHSDGSAPVWLSNSDVSVDFLSPVDYPAARVRLDVSASAAVRSDPEWVRQGTLGVVYGVLSEDVPEVVLQLSVCGLPVADSTGASDWCVCVPRKSLAGHECAALGTHIRTLAMVAEFKGGIAVSADEKWLVVVFFFVGTISVYSLPGGELVRTFGGNGNRPLQFMQPRRLCFAPNGYLIVVDTGNKRLQEVTLEGGFVRSIGVVEFDDGDREPFCVVVHDDVIAVGCYGGTGPRVALFDFGTGAVTSRFGEVGTAPGQLSEWCTGIRFTPDGSHVIVAEDSPNRVSQFTIAGVFVRCVGVGVLKEGDKDVLQSVTGEFVVADSRNHCVCVFLPDGSELVRSWGVRGSGDGQFNNPTALAAAGQHLYVMDGIGGRVQVFE